MTISSPVRACSALLVLPLVVSAFTNLQAQTSKVKKPSSSPTYTLSTLYTFCSQGGSGCTDGSSPQAALVLASDGNFYGTTTGGGDYGEGTFFKMTPTGSLTPLYSFCSQGPETCPDGYDVSGVIEGPDGDFYGTTNAGGASHLGTVFKITPGGALTTLYTFDGFDDGGEPDAALTLGSDGNLYGSNEEGGPGLTEGSSYGEIFKITTAGVLTPVYSFNDYYLGYTPDAGGSSGLVQGTNGNFYATTIAGGVTEYCTKDSSCGTAFEVTPTGNLVWSYGFCSQADCTDGEVPWTSLVEGPNGDFYGTTVEGGSTTCEEGGEGTVFSITATGSLSSLYTFESCTNPGNIAPYAPLALGSDGNFYGTTTETVFNITSEGVFTTLADLDLPIGELGGQYAGFLQGTDGNFYNTTCGCSDNAYGTVYKLIVSPAIAAPVQLTLSSTSTSLGDNVTLNWSVNNAFSMTMQQCYAFVQDNATGAGTWNGKQAGTFSGGLYTGSASITPTAAGTYTYALTCGGQESGFATLTVTGSKLPIKFTSTTHNFGSVIDGTTAAAYGVKLTNPNSTIFPFTMNLTGASAFTQVNNCGTQVAAGGTCEIVFYFKPASTGKQSATWNLTANGETFSPANGGTLSGTGVNDGSLSLTTSVHNFGDQTVGTTSGVYGTVLTNSYAFPVTLAFSTTGNTADFTTTANNCGTTLRANASCNLQYEFSPKAKGFLTETMGITATYNGSPVTIMSLGSPVTGVVLKGTGD